MPEVPATANAGFAAQIISSGIFRAGGGKAASRLPVLVGDVERDGIRGFRAPRSAFEVLGMTMTPSRFEQEGERDLGRCRLIGLGDMDSSGWRRSRPSSIGE